MNKLEQFLEYATATFDEAVKTMQEWANRV
jgi:hypothetical protein